MPGNDTILRPEGHPASLPWPPTIRDYPPDHPARRDEESKQAFNEDWARADFGDGFVEKLKGEQRNFAGDWWMLALLVRCAEIAEKQDPKGEDLNRLVVIEDARRHLHHRDVYTHLEHAWLHFAQLEHADLRAAHLEHAWLRFAQLEHADLRAAHLEHAILDAAHLEHARLNQVHLEHADLRAAHLEHAELVSAYLEDAKLLAAHLDDADLSGAHLDNADLSAAHLDNAVLSGAHLEHANLMEARLEHAYLAGAHLEHADLTEAVLTGAELRRVSGLRFDSNRVRDIHIEGNALDPWSVLRRSYSGPWFFLHAALLIAFLLPYVGKVLALTAADHAGRVYERFALQDPRITIVKIPAWKVLIGLDKAWWVPTLGAILLVYNVIRGVLTLKVGMLRDAEERSGITPELGQYMGTQGLNDESLPGALARLARDLFKWLTRMKIREETQTSYEDIGLWRLHRLLKVLFWIAILSFTFHAVHWVWTTKLRHLEIAAPAAISNQPSSPAPDR